MSNVRQAAYFPFFEALADGIVISEEAGRILYMNPAAEALLSVELPDAAGQSLCELLCAGIPAAQGGNAGCPLRRPGGEESSMTYCFRVNTERAFRWAGAGVHRSDQWRHVRVRCHRTLVPWLDSSDGEKHLTIIEDVSAEAELDRRKEDWRSMIAHDLRNPLTTIYASMRLLQDAMAKRAKAPPEARFIGITLNNCQRMVELLDLYLDMAKLDAGLMPASAPAAINLAESVSRGVGQASLAEEKKIDLVREVPPDLTVLADAELLRRILENLLSNALKFTPPGGSVRIEARREKPGTVVLSFADNGPGIGPDDLPLIFDRYHQGKARREGRIQGTGLGLAFCREALRVMGGSIEAKSKPGAGSVFSVRLPEGK